MGFFGSFTGSDQRKDAKRGYAESNSMLDQGYGKASGQLDAGYSTAIDAFGGARSDLGAGYNAATSSLDAYTGKAADAFSPFMQGGADAYKLYADALGVNGIGAQQAFGQNFQSSDPFRQQNSDMANEALMRTLNARGMSGGGYAADAVARASLQRGSQDYNSYLDRLQGAGSQGLQAASGLAGVFGNAGQQRSSLDYGYGSDLANIQGQKANLATTMSGAQAGLSTDLASSKAGNRINLANSLSASRSIGINNLMGLGGMALKAYGGGFGAK